jgi:aryl-alcohol dehydrogenase-like predicted oxidoreductase
VEDLLGEMGRLEFVLRFTLSHPGLSSTIVGTSKLEHLQANVTFAEKGPLPAELYEEAKGRLAAPAS